MVSADERLKILTMIQEGMISASEGIQLLESLERSRPAQSEVTLPPPPVPSAGGRGARFLRVRVTDTNTGKTRVNIRLPINVVNAGIRMGARFAPEVEGLEVSQLMQYIQAGETGQVVDVYDDEDGEHVEVFLE
ncbi:MAG TPA: hypothetical protein VFF68_02010 [Anaerolineaceae bacterium]|nr:hypothetical protein [Anaerolineaceae bacterium]